ncbi:MAG: aspartyl protease family protein [Verrucomicrobiales bacterium]
MAFAQAKETQSFSTNYLTIPFELRGERVILTAKVNGERSVTLLLDSACTIPTVKPEVMDTLDIKPSGRVRINGIAGVERAPTYQGVSFDFGSGVVYSPDRIASIPSERGENHRRRDGVIGSGFFESYVVEFDPNADHLKLYSPKDYSYSGNGVIVPFKLRKDIPVVSASLVLSNHVTVQGEFEIDTGCDSGICIGESFIRQHKLLEATSGEESEKFGVGGSVETRSATIPQLKMGGVHFTDAQSDLFLDGSPVDDPLAGHIGAEILRRKKVIYDYARNRLIIE